MPRFQRSLLRSVTLLVLVSLNQNQGGRFFFSHAANYPRCSPLDAHALPFALHRQDSASQHSASQNSASQDSLTAIRCQRLRADRSVTTPGLRRFANQPAQNTLPEQSSKQPGTLTASTPRASDIHRRCTTTVTRDPAPCPCLVKPSILFTDRSSKDLSSPLHSTASATDTGSHGLSSHCEEGKLSLKTAHLIRLSSVIGSVNSRLEENLQVFIERPSTLPQTRTQNPSLHPSLNPIRHPHHRQHPSNPKSEP